METADALQQSGILGLTETGSPKAVATAILDAGVLATRLCLVSLEPTGDGAYGQGLLMKKPFPNTRLRPKRPLPLPSSPLSSIWNRQWLLRKCFANPLPLYQDLQPGPSWVLIVLLNLLLKRLI